MSNIDNTENTNTEAPAAAIAPLCVGVEKLAAVIDCSPKKVYQMNTSGQLPRPIYLPSRGLGERPSPRWPWDELRGWVSAGMPSRQRWEEIKAERGEGRA